MKITVMKFGGTSLVTSQSRMLVLEHIKTEKMRAEHLLVVVSAMGREGDPYSTDTLLNLYTGGSNSYSSRERDIIYSCGEIISGTIMVNQLNQHGIDSVFLDGRQVGIITDSSFENAQIIRIEPERLNRELQHKVVVVAGGQGVSEAGDITILGRGGSDTTACVLAAALGAERTCIYTDVDGVFTGDPRKITNARQLKTISFDFCKKMAQYGAKVIHPKAVYYAQQSGKNGLQIRSTFSENEGTYIGDGRNDVFGVCICEMPHPDQNEVFVVTSMPHKEIPSEIHSRFKIFMREFETGVYGTTCSKDQSLAIANRVHDFCMENLFK